MDLLCEDFSENKVKMKQHITVAQLHELNDQEIYDLVVYKLNKFMINNLDDEWYEWISQLINIGKMIEILCDSDFCFPSIGLTESRNHSEYIVVGVTSLSGSKEYYGKTFESDNLCDALWNAVKSALLESKK